MTKSRNAVAVGYRRVSTDKQKKSGLGLEDQERVIREFCQRQGLTLDEHIFTEAESGKRNDRIELARAMARAKKLGGILVIAKLDRFSRRVKFIAEIMESGVPFVCADAPEDEPFILHVKASFAEEEARKISQRTKAGIAALKMHGTKEAGYFSAKQGRVVTLGTNNLTDTGRKKAGNVQRERHLERTKDIKPKVLELHAKGASLRGIANFLEISHMTVSRILKDNVSTA